MRTTLTLDDDVVHKVRADVRRTGRSFKSVVNEALRRGLEEPPVPPVAFVVEPWPLDLRPGVEVDDVWGLLDRLDPVRP